MRIRTFFLVGISAAAVTGILAAAMSLSAAWTHHEATARAGLAIEAFDATARIMEAIATERGPTNLALATDVAAGDKEKSTLLGLRQKTDEVAMTALERLRRSGSDGETAPRVAALETLTRALQTLRSGVDGAIAQPKAQRDPSFMRSHADRFYDIYRQGAALLDRLHRVPVAATPDLPAPMLSAGAAWGL